MDERQEPEDRRQEPGDRRQETEDRRQETEDRSQDPGARSQETGDGEWMQVGPAGEVGENQARTWAAFCHLAGLACFLGIPFGNIVGPLIIWMLKKNEIPRVDEHGREALNFQLSFTIYAAVCGMLVFIFIGIPMLVALMITMVVLVIMSAVKASNGEPVRYPFTIRFIN